MYFVSDVVSTYRSDVVSVIRLTNRSTYAPETWFGLWLYILRECEGAVCNVQWLRNHHIPASPIFSTLYPIPYVQLN